MPQPFELSPRMTSAAFSLNMYIGTATKNPGMAGKAEASTTRKLVTPRTRKRESSTAFGSSSAPIGHEHDT